MDRYIHKADADNKMTEVKRLLLSLIPYAQKKIAAANLEKL